jgi:hypothetical protein
VAGDDIDHAGPFSSRDCISGMSAALGEQIYLPHELGSATNPQRGPLAGIGCHRPRVNSGYCGEAWSPQTPAIVVLMYAFAYAHVTRSVTLLVCAPDEQVGCDQHSTTSIQHGCKGSKVDH